MRNVVVMGTGQYAQEVYSKHSKTKTGSSARIRRMILDDMKLPQVVKIEKIGRDHILYVDLNAEK